MAPGQTDVNLVIRARDEASSTVTSLTSAINNFTQANQTAVERARLSDTTYQQLAQSLKTLKDAAAQLADSAKLAQALQKAGDAATKTQNDLVGLQSKINTLRTESAQTAASLAQVNAALNNSKTASAGYKAQLEALATAEKVASDARKQSADVLKASLATQKTLLSDAKSSLQALNAEEIKLANTEQKLVESQTKLNAELAQYRQELARVATSVQAANTAQASAKKAYDDGKAQLAAYNAQIKALASTETARKAELQSMVAAQTQANAALKSAYDAAKTATAGLVAEQKKLETAQKNTTKALSETSAKLTELSAKETANAASMAQLRAAYAARVTEVKRLETELAALSAQEASASAAQIARVTQINASLSRQTAETARLEAQIRSLTTEQTRNATSAQRALDAATRMRAELTAQRAALAAAEQAARAAGINTSRLASETARLDAELLRTRGDVAAAAAALNQYDVSLGRTTADAERLRAAQQRVAAAAQQTSTAHQSAARSVNAFGEESRKAMSVIQRYRGEILSLIMAYVGLQTAFQQVGSSLQSFMNLQGTTAKFAMVTKNAGDELAYVAEQAKRLGLPVAAMEKNYSSLFVIMRNMGIESSRVREVFEGISEAATVMQLSAADVEGVFKALIQIFSKGTIQAEELKQQLGDRFPGAVEIMARAVGVTTGELFKMMEQGKLTSDRMFDFVKILKSDISAGLPLAMKSFRAELNRTGIEAEMLKRKFGEELASQLIEPMKRLNAVMQDPKTEANLKKVAEALGLLADVAITMVENLDKIVLVIQVILGLKLAAWATSVAVGVAQVAGAATAATLPMAGFAAASTSLSLALPAIAAFLGRIALISLPVAMIAAAGVGVYDLSKAFIEYKDATESLAEAERKQRLEAEAKITYFDELSQKLGILVTNQAELNQEVEWGNVYFERATGEYKKMADMAVSTRGAVGDFSDTVNSLEERLKKLGIQLTGKDMAIAQMASRALADTLFDAAIAGESLEQQQKDVNRTLTETAKTEDGIIKVAHAMDIVRESSNKASEGLLVVPEDISRAASVVEQELQKVILGLDRVNLAAVSNDLKKGFEEGKVSAEQFGNIAQLIADKSLADLGVNADEAFGRISDGANEAIVSFRAFGDSLKGTFTDPATKMQALEVAASKVIETLKTSTDVKVFGENWKAVAKELGATDEVMQRVQVLLDAQKLKIDEAKAGINSLAEGYKTLGITSLKSLQDAAIAASALYAETVKAKAPIFEQQQAYAAMVKAQLAAAAAQGQAALQAKIVTLEATAQTKEQRAEVEKLKEKYQQLGQIPMPTPDLAPVVAGFQQAGNAATEFDNVMRGIAGANTQGQLNEASDNLNKSYSEGKISSEEYAIGIGAVTDKSKDLRTELKVAATYLDGMTDSMKKATAQIWTQSTATAEIAENMRGMLDAVQSGSWDSATAELERNTVALEAQADAARKAADEWSHQFDILSRAGGADYISAVVAQARMSEIMAEQAIAANELKIAQIQLGEAVDSLKDKAEDGNITLEQQRDQLVELQGQYTNLDDASLRNLRSEIDAVNGKLLAMQEQSEATLNALREEQARQSGNEAEATRLSNAEKIKKLEKDISEAQKAGNDEAVKTLREALAIQEQLNAAAIKEAEAKKKSADESERAAKAAPKTTTSPTTTTNTTTNSTKVVVEVSGTGLSQLDQRALSELARKLAPELNTLARRGLNV